MEKEALSPRHVPLGFVYSQGEGGTLRRGVVLQGEGAQSGQLQVKAGESWLASLPWRPLRGAPGLSEMMETGREREVIKADAVPPLGSVLMLLITRLRMAAKTTTKIVSCLAQFDGRTRHGSRRM